MSPSFTQQGVDDPGARQTEQRRLQEGPGVVHTQPSQQPGHVGALRRREEELVSGEVTGTGVPRK